MLTDEEFDQVQLAHEKEAWWYLFSNYGAPISNPEYVKRFEAVEQALKEYINFCTEIAEEDKDKFPGQDTKELWL